MHIEDQVTSIDLAKRLKKLGVQQKSFFYWIDSGRLCNESELTSRKKFESKSFETYSAFTASELGEMLPEITIQKNPEVILPAFGWSCGYPANSIINNQNAIKANEPTLADSLASMLIYLIKAKKRYY